MNASKKGGSRVNTDELQKITIYEGKHYLDEFPYDDWEKWHDKTTGGQHYKTCKRCQEWDSDYDNNTHKVSPIPSLKSYTNKRIIHRETRKLLSQGIFNFKVIEGFIWTKEVLSIEASMGTFQRWTFPDPHVWIELVDGTIIDPGARNFDDDGGIVERLDGDVLDMDGLPYASLEGVEHEYEPYYTNHFTPLHYLYWRDYSLLCWAETHTMRCLALTINDEIDHDWMENTLMEMRDAWDKDGEVGDLR